MLYTVWIKNVMRGHYDIYRNIWSSYQLICLYGSLIFTYLSTYGKGNSSRFYMKSIFFIIFESFILTYSAISQDLFRFQSISDHWLLWGGFWILCKECNPFHQGLSDYYGKLKEVTFCSCRSWKLFLTYPLMPCFYHITLRKILLLDNDMLASDYREKKWKNKYYIFGQCFIC